MGGPDDWLPLSGIQHFCFCRRQWALIHLEQQWAENRRTVEGQLDHARCHDANQTERRGGLLITRGMQVVSRRLGLSGNCDVVEFRADPEGIPLQNAEGLWKPMPVEYKHGRAKASDADRLQLCACLLYTSDAADEEDNGELGGCGRRSEKTREESTRRKR